MTGIAQKTVETVQEVWSSANPALKCGASEKYWIVVKHIAIGGVSNTYWKNAIARGDFIAILMGRVNGNDIKTNLLQGRQPKFS